MKYLFIIVIFSSSITTMHSMHFTNNNLRMKTPGLIFPLKQAFDSGDGIELVKLCTRDPQLIPVLEKMSTNAEKHGKWGHLMVTYIQSEKDKPVGRIKHNSHPIVQKEEQSQQPRARL